MGCLTSHNLVPCSLLFNYQGCNLCELGWRQTREKGLLEVLLVHLLSDVIYQAQASQTKDLWSQFLYDSVSFSGTQQLAPSFKS